MKALPRWLYNPDDAPEWARGDLPRWVFLLIFGSIVATVVPLIWLADRGMGGKVLFVAGMAALVRWLAWVLPRVRRDSGHPSGRR